MGTQKNLLVEWLAWTDCNRRGLFPSCLDHSWSAKPHSRRLQILTPQERTFGWIQRKGCGIDQSQLEASPIIVLGKNNLLKTNIRGGHFKVFFFSLSHFLKFKIQKVLRQERTLKIIKPNANPVLWNFTPFTLKIWRATVTCY